MIKSFRHKGLENFFYDGSKKGIQPKHARKLADILDRLHAAKAVEDMNFPGSGLHPLKGDRKGWWAVEVSGNWRVTFSFQEGNAEAVDYVDYH
ncbi:MAG: type II toxin-antitoxin system RelE/ParE family toxin [Deltaproteobacteria bacterium]|nr:type II toxin-antitoxin system RelE/ParE family toxin [Deltaproteobacteria bacterium]